MPFDVLPDTDIYIGHEELLFVGLHVQVFLKIRFWARQGGSSSREPDTVLMHRQPLHAHVSQQSHGTSVVALPRYFAGSHRLSWGAHVGFHGALATTRDDERDNPFFTIIVDSPVQKTRKPLGVA